MTYDILNDNLNIYIYIEYNTGYRPKIVNTQSSGYLTDFDDWSKYLQEKTSKKKKKKVTLKYL